MTVGRVGLGKASTPETFISKGLIVLVKEKIIFLIFSCSFSFTHPINFRVKWRFSGGTMLRRPSTAERAALICWTFFLIFSDRGIAIKRRILEFVSSIRQKIFFSFKFLAEFLQSAGFYLADSFTSYT